MSIKSCNKGGAVLGFTARGGMFGRLLLSDTGLRVNYLLYSSCVLITKPLICCKGVRMLTNKVSVKESLLFQRRSSRHQNVNYQGHVWATLTVPRALSHRMSGTCAAEHTAALLSFNVSLSRLLFFFPAALQLLGDRSSLSKQVFCL